MGLLFLWKVLNKEEKTGGAKGVDRELFFVERARNVVEFLNVIF